MQFNDEFHNVNEGERELICWQYNMQGGFKKALWDLFGRADLQNLALLKRGFPEEVEAFERFAYEPGYFEELVKKVTA